MSSLLLIMSVGTLVFRQAFLSFCNVKFVGRKKTCFACIRCPNVHVPPKLTFIVIGSGRDAKLDFYGFGPWAIVLNPS